VHPNVLSNPTQPPDPHNCVRSKQVKIFQRCRFLYLKAIQWVLKSFLVSAGWIGLDPGGVHFPWLYDSDWTRPRRCALPLTLWLRLNSARAVCTPPDSVSQIGLDPGSVHFSWLCESDWTRSGQCALSLILWAIMDSIRAVCTSPDSVSQIRLDPDGVQFPWLCESDWPLSWRCVFPLTLGVRLKSTRAVCSSPDLWARMDSIRAVCTSPDSVSQIGLDRGGVHFPWLCESDWTRLDSTRPDPTVLVGTHPHCAGLCAAAQTRYTCFPFVYTWSFTILILWNVFFSLTASLV